MKMNAATLRNDIQSGLVVFLVALPLCLGIAVASGATPFAGIISGVIGGIVVGIMSGSHVSVSGPTAGLIAIILTAITQLGFDDFLLALVLASLIDAASEEVAVRRAAAIAAAALNILSI